MAWDGQLRDLLQNETLSGYALLSHLGEPIAAAGALQAEFELSDASGAAAAPAALQVMALFNLREDGEAQSATLTLCGQRLQVRGRLRRCWPREVTMHRRKTVLKLPP